MISRPLSRPRRLWLWIGGIGGGVFLIDVVLAAVQRHWLNSAIDLAVVLAFCAYPWLATSLVAFSNSKRARAR